MNDPLAFGMGRDAKRTAVRLSQTATLGSTLEGFFVKEKDE